MEDLQASQHLSECERSVDELVEIYNNGVQSIVNHHAPFCSKLITLRPETSWNPNRLRSGKIKVGRKQAEPGTELP